MGLNELIRRALFEGYASKPLSISAILICICITALIGAYIFILYRRINAAVFYNRNFNVSLVTIAIITAAIIITIQSNIVVSLGMVGALSIVRFRTAVKDPLDLVFLFWAISVGIICGAGFALIAIIASLVLTVIILLLLSIKQEKNITMLTIRSGNFEAENIIMDIIRNNCSYSNVRAQNMDKNGMDMTIEVRIGEKERLVHELMKEEFIQSVSFVDNSGNSYV
ncbi:MAG TPA: DUF4956 domain-containing protein [Lachnospiraceae bacterium]|nr:DUF4956 domain-containing protein [Lachnospiraceae bacterium]HAV00419.1 DUF4956 domain-containing protein [Lachnospiraceae bacterium]